MGIVNTNLRVSVGFILAMMLSACQSTQQHTLAPARAESAEQQRAATQPLGVGQSRATDVEAVAYLLLEKDGANHARSQRACKALFEPLSGSVTSPHIVTYLPVDRVGDFSRTSPRFNQALCKHLSGHGASQLEQGLRDVLDEPETRGPYLVVVPQQMGIALNLQESLVIDLSLVRDQDLPGTIHNWRQHVMPERALWQGVPDLEGLYTALSRGLSQVQIAAATQGDASKKL